MFLFNKFKNINKKSILYSISTINISTNFGMNNKKVTCITKDQKENINSFIFEKKNTSFLGKKVKNSLEYGFHNKFHKADIRKKIFIKFSDYILRLLNNKLKQIKENCDIFEGYKKDINFTKLKSLKHLVLNDVCYILNSKIGYYCLNTGKNDYNEKLINMCIMCENSCKDLCDIFCSNGYEIYNDFLNSQFYQNILIKIEQKKGYEYKNRFNNIAKNVIFDVKNMKFSKRLNMNKKRILDKNIDENLKCFFENRINYYDEIFNKEINIKEDNKLDFSELSKNEISNYKDIFNVKDIDNK